MVALVGVVRITLHTLHHPKQVENHYSPNPV